MKPLEISRSRILRRPLYLCMILVELAVLLTRLFGGRDGQSHLAGLSSSALPDWDQRRRSRSLRQASTCQPLCYSPTHICAPHVWEPVSDQYRTALPWAQPEVQLRSDVSYYKSCLTSYGWDRLGNPLVTCLIGHCVGWSFSLFVTWPISIQWRGVMWESHKIWLIRSQPSLGYDLTLIFPRSAVRFFMNVDREHSRFQYRILACWYVIKCDTCPWQNK